MKPRITLDLSAHPRVFDRIQKTAAAQSRSMAGQLLFETLPVLLDPPSVKMAALLKRKAPKGGAK
jgi:hypothetical protein